MKFFREPLVHFLVIGAAIFVLYGFYGTAGCRRTGAGHHHHGRRNRLAFRYLEKTLEPAADPGGAGEVLIKQYLRETILYREAVAMGLDKDDTVIRRRLAQKLEFLYTTI